MNAKNLALNLLIKAKDLASDVVRTFKGEVADSAKQAEKLDESVDKANESLTENAGAAEKAGRKTGKYSEQLSEADKAAGRFSGKQERLKDNTSRYAKSAERGADKTGQLKRKLEQTSIEAQTLSGRLSLLSGKIKGLLVGGAITAGLGRLFSGAVRSSAEFERQLNKVEAVTGATADEMGRLKQAATEAGSSTEFTATQAAQGLEILARAGFTAGQSIELLPSLLATATAEGLELSEAAQLITDTVSIMQLEVAKGGRAADILAKGSSLSATTMLQLGNAISYSGQFAREAGLDLEQLVAILDLLAKNGLRGERAGTGLRAILAQISDPASKASKALEELGIPTDNFIRMLDALKASGENGKAAINAFGIEAGPALRALLSEGSEGLREFETQLRDAEGAAQQMADTASDDLVGSARGFGSAWDTLRKKLGDPLLKPLADLLDRVADKFRELASDGSVETWGNITAYTLNRVAGALQIVFNGFTLAAKSIGIFGSQVAVWVAETEVAVAKLLNLVGLVNDATVQGLEMQANGARAVLDAFVAEAAQDLEDLGDGWDLLTGKVDLGMKKAEEAAAKNQKQATQAIETVKEVAEASAEAQQKSAEATAAATKAQSEAWKTLGHDINEVTDSVTEQGQEAIQSFGTIARAGKYSAEQIRLAFDSALAKTRTKADLEALLETLKKLKKEGVRTGQAYRDAFSTVSDKIRELETATKGSSAAVNELNNELAETDTTGTESVGNVSKAVRQLTDDVSALSDEYREAAKEADGLASSSGQEASGREKKSRASRSSYAGKVGAEQYYTLMKNGEREAAEIFNELAGAFARKSEGKVILGAKAIEQWNAELEGLVTTARRQARNRLERSGPDGFDTRHQAPQRRIAVDFNVGGRQVTAEFSNENELELLLTQLSDVARVSR